VSAAEKYGAPFSSLSAETLSQVKQEGNVLAEKGVTHQASLGSGSPAPTPAVKYGAPVNSETLGKSLAQERSR
jgi:hypothetical protein